MLTFSRAAALAFILGLSASPVPALSEPEEPPVPARPANPMLGEWSRANAIELLNYVEGVGPEGLDPARYDPAGLRAAIAAGEGQELNAAATRAFLALSSDLAVGRLRGPERVQWYLEDDPIDGHQQFALMDAALQQGRVRQRLDSLLPAHPQYGALRQALAATPAADKARRETILINMERWRWLPRDLGPRYVFANVPAFTAELVEEGETVALHKTMIGTTRHPTPQFSAEATGVTFNPWWHVPQSMVREMSSFYGYEVSREGDTLRVRQPPGPRNALGRMRVNMENRHAIFLHDTPHQSLFAQSNRAVSRGCLRTEHALRFAELLLAPTARWNRSAIDRTVASGRTTVAALDQPVPVYVVYFTAAVDGAGRLVTYGDVYGRDAPVRRALAAR